jgi:hypothetical protein
MEQAVHKEAWERTGAVKWSFFDEHDYVWDRDRGLVEARWGETRVLFRTGDRTGRAWGKDGELTGAEAESAIEQAYKFWINDSFWLNPVVKLFDPGVNREIVVDEEGETGLLVTYTSGGVTPGDAYLWYPGPEGLPERWRMWVSIIPIGGVTMTWEGWTELATGALISTEHEGGGKVMKFIQDVEGAESLDDLDVTKGIFSPLLRR